MDVYQKMLPIRTIEQAKAIRNQSWQKCELIPTWVDQEKVDLDCFYTHPDVAHECSDVWEGKSGRLASMDKDSSATFKLTKKPSDLLPITEFTDRINEIAKSRA